MPVLDRQTLEAAPSVPGQHWLWRDQPVYYVRAGEPRRDRPPLLLIHGFGASTDHWRKNIAELQQDFEVWAIDLLGFGRSAKPNWEYSGDLWRDQLHDFIQSQIGRPTVVAGNSLGGYAALCVAAERPESAAGVILLNSAGPFTPTTPPAPPNPLKRAIADATKAIALSPIGSYLIFQNARRKSTIKKTLQKVYVDQSAVTERLVDEIYQPSCDRGAVQVFASVFKAPRGKNIDQLLATLACPLYTLWGEGDPWMKCRDRAAQFRQHYPQLTETFLAAGHCPHDEAPEQVNQLIRQWMHSL